jgi:hypothetical protein
MKLNPTWKEEVDQKIIDFKEKGIHFSFTLSWIKSKQYLIHKLLENEIPYRIENCGSGVVFITTDTKVCPLCKNEL